jgi:transposase
VSGVIDESATVEFGKKLEALAAEVAVLRAERDTYKKAYLDLLGKFQALERGILFQGRERDLTDSLTLPLLAMVTSQATNQTSPTVCQTPPNPSSPTPTVTVPQHERKKPTGRRPLPENLPRVHVEVIPPEVKQKGLENFERIGEDVSETVERRPASLVVVQIHRPKFVEKKRAQSVETIVRQAPPPELPIPRALAAPGLLAHTVVSRWADHLPLHRLERIFGRDGWDLARSTICEWHGELASLVAPLIAAMWQDAMASPYLCVDATGVLVQEVKKCRRGHFFVVAAPERHVLFAYSPKHDSAAVDDLLRNYTGYLVADAHTVYEHLYRGGNVIECGCWAHARRYFFKALGTDPERAKHALGRIGELFKIERLHATWPPEKKLLARQEKSKPIVDDFFTWCRMESLRVLDETPISKAIRYALNQETALRRFLEDGRVPMHNNLSERELRREAVGRKNWLFLGSDDGGDVNATFVTLLASCQRHGIEPVAYLRDLLCLLPDWKVHEVLDLAPVNWPATSQREDVRQLLAANIFRRISLGADS